MALDDETHFVLVVPVLAIELCDHRIKSRGLSVDGDHIGSDVAPRRLQFFDFLCVSLENFFCRGIRLHGMLGLPVFIPDAASYEIVANQSSVSEFSVFIDDFQDCHTSRFLFWTYPALVNTLDIGLRRV